MEIEKPNISDKQFAAWRSPRRGRMNPEVMTNPLWSWLVHTGLTAYQANEVFEGPSSLGAGPCWSFDRYGQTSTPLGDGRVVFIGGEHEDGYDPDFYIYNDVVLIDESGEVTILGYPVDVFPATDFHSATLGSDGILIVGCLGYPDDRRRNMTQVMRLELESWNIAEISTDGDCPGWLHGHDATLSADGRELLITAGHIDGSPDTPLIENIEDWKLDTRTWRWSRLTERRWVQFRCFRQDSKRNHLWELRQLQWSKSVNWKDTEERALQLEEQLGSPPRLDILSKLYVPELSDDVLGEDEENHRVHRIRVNGVIVRYVEDWGDVFVTVEGNLETSVVDAIQRDLVEKLEALEQSAISIENLQPQ